LTDGLNQHKVFLAMAHGHINTEIFRDSVNSQIGIEGIFRQMFVSSDYSGATSLTRITLKFTIVDRGERFLLKMSVVTA
jgi:hypothetical protein